MVEAGLQPGDDDLMARAAAGDETAFGLLVQRWERPVFAFLARMLGSREEAEDLAQEAFLRAWRNASRYRASGQFKSWLFRIVGNLARSRLRRRKIVRWISFDPVAHDKPTREDTGEQTLERAETRQSVREAIGRLPERQRQALLLKMYDGLSYQEIASTMEVSVPAVESLLHRATTALRKELLRKRESE